MSVALRSLIGDAIEALVALADALDGDPDLEAEFDLGVDDQPHDADPPEKAATLTFAADQSNRW